MYLNTQGLFNDGTKINEQYRKSLKTIKNNFRLRKFQIGSANVEYKNFKCFKPS